MEKIAVLQTNWYYECGITVESFKKIVKNIALLKYTEKTLNRTISFGTK